MKRFLLPSLVLLFAAALSLHAAPPPNLTQAATYAWKSADGRQCTAAVKAGEVRDVTFKVGRHLEFVIKDRIGPSGELKKGDNLRQATQDFFRVCVHQPELLSVEDKDWRVRSARLGASYYTVRHINIVPEG